MKAFTTTGVCTKENNYMVDITDRLVKMKAMVDAGFSSEQTFVKTFCRKLKRETRAGLIIPDNIKNQIDDFLS